MKRDIRKVIKKLQATAPQEWDMRIQFIDALNIMMQKTSWTAPENESDRFAKLGDVLDKYVGNPDKLWKTTMFDIFTNQMKYETYEHKIEI